MVPRQHPQGSPRAREDMGINRLHRLSMHNLGAIDKRIMAFFAFAAVLWLIAPSLQAVFKCYPRDLLAPIVAVYLVR